MTAPQRRVGLHRDVQFELDTLTRIRASADWLEQHLPDLHDLAYAPSSGSDDPHAQTSTTNDLSSRIGRPAQHAWHQVHRALDNALLELQRAEYTCGEQFTAGTLPEPDRPGRDSSMPKNVARQVKAAAARRKQRGEGGPQPLKEIR